MTPNPARKEITMPAKLSHLQLIMLCSKAVADGRISIDEAKEASSISIRMNVAIEGKDTSTPAHRRRFNELMKKIVQPKAATTKGTSS